MKSLKGWPASAIDAAGLGIALALADALLHPNVSKWLEVPFLALRSFFWMALLYAVGTVILVAVLRCRSRVAFAAVSGFVFAQAGLWLYRGNLIGGSLTPKLAVFAMVAVLAFGWPASRLQKRVSAGSAVSLLLVVGVLLAGGISLFRPASKPAMEEAWPPSSSSPQVGEDRPNLLLITLDTTRPDRLGAYGYKAIETPNINALAAGGALFLNGVAQAPITPTSHASIMSGLLPARHGLHDFEHDNRFSPDDPLLAELLAGTGYVTGALVASAALSPAYSLDRGFDVYQLTEPESPGHFQTLRESLLPSVIRHFGLGQDYMYREGHLQTDDAVRWMHRYSGTPFFLWVHYFDAHDPYNLHPEFGRQEYRAESGILSRFKRTYRYDSEVLGIDREIGRLVAALSKLGIDDNTIVAVISDHGEGLGDHGYVGHTGRLFGEQLRLVLMLRYPEVIPAGLEVPSQVRSVDLMPTVLELMGFEPPGGLDGESLVELFAPAEPATGFPV